ncbi:MAG: methylated-DNA--[protein]-cysteine S-methyltransferase [Oligoflexia bacterium]|nr:methylated-DNA--[protein]-cysteine S-methyltransferase [Oligoflexia bacterium]
MNAFANLFSTPIGKMAFAWNENNKVVLILLPQESDEEIRASMEKRLLKKKFSNVKWTNKLPKQMFQVQRSIISTLNGKKSNFSWEDFHWLETTEFFRSVYKKAMSIPMGKTLTYGELSLKAGLKNGARAVGQAMARNPYPIVVPCHRVWGHNKKAVGFSAFGGVDTKTKIMQIEQGSH